MTETLEKAHKGDPGYEKWLAKYRAFRTAKAAKDNDAAKSEIEKEADNKRRSDLAGTGGRKADQTVSKNSADLDEQDAARREAEEDTRKVEADEQARKNAKNERDAEDEAKRKPGDTKKSSKRDDSKAAEVSRQKKVEIAKRFMERISAKKADKDKDE